MVARNSDDDLGFEPKNIFKARISKRGFEIVMKGWSAVILKLSEGKEVRFEHQKLSEKLGIKPEAHTNLYSWPKNCKGQKLKSLIVSK